MHGARRNLRYLSRRLVYAALADLTGLLVRHAVIGAVFTGFFTPSWSHRIGGRNERNNRVGCHIGHSIDEGGRS
jgi:hypothetical protein